MVVGYTEDELIAAGIRQGDLTLAFWDENNQSWSAIPTKVDTVNGTVTAMPGIILRSSHFSVIAHHSLQATVSSS